VYGASLAIRIKGSDPDAFAGRLREISATIDPNLQLRNVATLDAVLRQEQGMMRLVAAVLAVLTISVLLLAAAGIYALVSFTVAQRRKEIGIRAALGADPGQIFRGIFSRALWQMGAGAAIGVLVAALLEVATDGGLMSGHGTVVLPMVTGLVMTVGMLAVLAPARRGWRVHPTEALREQ
jgi:ABC-type antimicrobial peptide transport system permease subunit